MLEVQKYLLNNSVEDLCDEYGIICKSYTDRIILKYGITSKRKYEKITCECRGLVLSLPDYKVLGRGFDRFFNLGEDQENQKSFNWDNCTVTEKMDGSCCKCFFDGEKWCVSTNGTAFAEGTTPMGKTYHDLFVEAIGMDLQEAFEEMYKNHTYIFELTSPENRIVTRYNETKITLLAIRNNQTGDFLDYSILKSEVLYIPFTNLVESYDFDDPNDVVRFVESRNQLDEGVVVYDNETQQRIKVKNSNYVAIHAIRSNEITKKNIITLLLNGEMDEYLNYFDNDIKIMQPYIDKYNQLKTDVISTYNLYKNIKDQKEFAMNVLQFPYKSFLFSLRKGLTMDQIFDIMNLNHIMKYFEGE